MSKRVAATPTPLSLDSIARELTGAFVDVMGRKPTRNEAEWLAAIVMLENRNGQSIIAHNWGNRVYSHEARHWVPRWADWELRDEDLTPDELATRRRLLNGEAVPTAFAAYASHREGARAFVKLFTQEEHKRILKAARANDPQAFLKAIATPHENGRQYCIECNTPAHLESYQKARNTVHDLKLFSPKHTKKVAPSRSQEGSFLPFVLFTAAGIGVYALLKSGKRKSD